MIVPISVLFSSLMLAPPPDARLAAYFSLGDSTRAPSSCEEILDQPTRDSAIVRLVISAFKLGDQPPLPPDIAPLLAEGIRQFFVVPNPLRLTTYQPTDSSAIDPTGFARQTVEGEYMLVVRRNGRLSLTKTLGGSGNAQFDKAVSAAVFALDTSALFPALPPKFPSDSIFIPIAVWPAQQDSDYRRRESVHALSLPTDLLSFKAPVQKVDSLPRSRSSNSTLRFPLTKLQRGGEERVFARFAIDTTGAIDLRTVLILSSTNDDFTGAVGRVLPSMRFNPLLIRGCKAKALVTFPFSFKINR